MSYAIKPTGAPGYHVLVTPGTEYAVCATCFDLFQLFPKKIPSVSFCPYCKMRVHTSHVLRGSCEDCSQPEG
jgi:hypothetical protein